MKTAYRRPRAIVLTVCLAGLLGLAMSSSAAQAALVREPASCGHTTVIRDFLKPLRRMVPIQEPPASGKLPFAPKRINLETRGNGLIAGGGLLGFSLNDQAIQQVRHLDWIVETGLARVDGRGEIVSRWGIKRRTLGTIRGSNIKDFLRRIPADPAFYRMDIRFLRRGSHRLLGAYSTYARVMRPRTELRVVIETPTVGPGEFASAKLMNLSTVPIESPAYDYGFNVQAFTGQEWIPRPQNPSRGRVPKRMQILPAGMENRGCLRYLVPADQAPGLFRFSAEGAQDELLAAEFEVAGHP